MFLGGGAVSYERGTPVGPPRDRQARRRLILYGLMSDNWTALSKLTNPPGHLWRDKWTALSGLLSMSRFAIDPLGFGLSL